MSRYPFNDGIEEFLTETFSSSDQTAMNKGRNRLQNIGRIVHLLKENRIIESDNPARLTPNDIQCFVDERRSGGVSDSTVSRDLSYLNDYLQFHHNDAVEEYLADIDAKASEEKREASQKALRKIFLGNSKDIKDPRMVRAYSFVMLAIVFYVHPDMLRKAKLRNMYENGLVNNYHITFIDRQGVERDVRLDLGRLPVVGRYIDWMFPLKVLSSVPEPLFPSSNPLFDHIGPEESRGFKVIVEKDIGCSFDYGSCTQIYLDMLEEDSPIVKKDPIPKGLWIPPVRRSLLDRLLGR